MQQANTSLRFHTFLEQQHQQYGPIIGYTSPFGLYVSVSGSELLKQLFEKVRFNVFKAAVILFVILQETTKR
jgi:hypothetical protein